MGDASPAAETPEQPTGKAWGDPIDGTRKQTLWGQLRASWEETDHGDRKGPFERVGLTGAEVFWLAVCAVVKQEDSTQDQAEVHLRNAHYSPVGSLRKLSMLALGGADLRGAQLQEAHLRGAQLQGAILSSAQLQGADLFGAQLEGADLSGAQLQRAHLWDAQLAGAILLGAQLAGAYLSSAQLQGAILSSAQLQGANLKGAQLQGANLSLAQLQGANFSGAQLEGANLFGVNLSQADLRQASFDKKSNLTGAILTDTRLDGVIFDNTNLAVVDWSQVPRLQDERIARQSRYDKEYGDEDKRGKRKPRAVRKDEYQAAVRAYRRLAVALQANGMNEEAAGYTYRAQVCQRQVLRYSGLRKVGPFFFSYLLDGLAGYGYAPGRTVLWYLALIFGFACAYWVLGPSEGHQFSFDGALVFSVTSFHGRGFFPGGLSLEDAITKLAALEAVIGLLIEISFIATFTQRFFGSK